MSIKQAAFAKLQPESVRRQVARAIENKIFSGELAIGKRLPPEEIRHRNRHASLLHIRW